MKIEVLGVGCPKCEKMYAATVEAVGKSGTVAEVVKTTDLDQIAAYGVFAFPAIAVDGQVVTRGKLLNADAIAALLAKNGLSR